jgi:HEAT repeat protein
MLRVPAVTREEGGMSRLLWPLAVVVALFVGWWSAGVASKTTTVREVERLTQQVTTLQARLRVAEEMAGAGVAASVSGSGGRTRQAGPLSERTLTASTQEDRLVQESLARAAASERARQGAAGEASPTRSDSQSKPAPPPTVQAVLDRFYRYLEATKTSERERWQKGRELVEDMRGMGDVAGQALMHVLTAGTDTDERRVAARMLGALHVPQSLPLLRDIVENDGDLLMRRAAAAGLRQLQTPDSLPLLERLLTNPGEDRFVRLSAAQGLADAGRPYGIAGLAQIFAESTADGRGREQAFRGLASLEDDRAAPYMRQIAATSGEPGYRLRAIRYLATNGDAQSLPILAAIMRNSSEQPSVRDAAGTAYRLLGGR